VECLLARKVGFGASNKNSEGTSNCMSCEALLLGDPGMTVLATPVGRFR